MNFLKNWLVKIYHFIGLTNLTDEQVEKFTENEINVINPYKWNGMWVFDDPNVGLHHEPFVAGVPELIEIATAGMKNPESGFVVVFSKNPFPDAKICLEWTRAECTGNIYLWREVNKEGWLCPALLRYFSSPPKNIYIQIKEK